MSNSRLTPPYNRSPELNKGGLISKQLLAEISERVPTTSENILVTTTKRGQEWLDFAKKVLEHIDNYTVPQYGDKGEDLGSEYTVADCYKGIRKYIAREGTNQRGGQEELDVLKIAHYACLAMSALGKPKEEVVVDNWLPVDENTPMEEWVLIQLGNSIYEGYQDRVSKAWITAGRSTLFVTPDLWQPLPSPRKITKE